MQHCCYSCCWVANRTRVVSYTQKWNVYIYIYIHICLKKVFWISPHVSLLAKICLPENKFLAHFIQATRMVAAVQKPFCLYDGKVNTKRIHFHCIVLSVLLSRSINKKLRPLAEDLSTSQGWDSTQYVNIFCPVDPKLGRI